MTTEQKWAIVPPPVERSRLFITSSRSVEWRFTDPPPNGWRRFWYWALLGWRWEGIS